MEWMVPETSDYDTHSAVAVDSEHPKNSRSAVVDLSTREIYSEYSVHSLKIGWVYSSAYQIVSYYYCQSWLLRQISSQWS